MPTDGRRVWKTELRSCRCRPGPASASDLIVFGTLRRRARSRSTRRRASSVGACRVGSEVLAAPAVAARRGRCATVDGRLRGFSARDGSELWTAEQSVPALDAARQHGAAHRGDDRRLAASSNGRIGAYALTNGEELWEAAIASPTGRNELERLVDVGAGDPDHGQRRLCRLLSGPRRRHRSRYGARCSGSRRCLRSPGLGTDHQQCLRDGRRQRGRSRSIAAAARRSPGGRRRCGCAT